MTTTPFRFKYTCNIILLKNLLLSLILILCANFSFAQNKSDANKIVKEGIELHDRGDYVGAIALYDKALELDTDNLFALTEKGYSLEAQGNHEEAINICARAIAKHPGESSLRYTYDIYGNALDALGESAKAIKIYDEGIKQFPSYYSLYFNKGVTLVGNHKSEEAILCFQKAVQIKPTHPGSHNSIGRLLDKKNERIPALLAFCRFLILEPQSKRAEEDLEKVLKIMKSGVRQNGNDSITINIDPKVLEETSKIGKKSENNFSDTDFLLSMNAALDFDEKYEESTEAQLFIKKFEGICISLKVNQKDNHGFYWDYYAPYFIEMLDKNLIETFGYIAFASYESPDVLKWLNENKTSTDKFYEWSGQFKWENKI